jgi:CxxC motif-containing protein (DUF1111 family)
MRLFLTCFVAIVSCYAQQDPGPRKGPAGAGGYYVDLNAQDQAFFMETIARFQQVDSVQGTIPAETGTGLGPTYNGNSCATCHAEPALGGSSPGLKSPQNPIPNPQVALATLDGATNAVPFFITPEGPVREARFISDGGVHDLYTIQGRTDAAGCVLAQPNFQQAAQQNNLIFRIPTPLFGLGFVETTPDSVLEANLTANPGLKWRLGIGGVFNTSSNDGTITRFGWKAQNKSLAVFAGEAYNVEMGVTNELFPNKRTYQAGCMYNGTPEDDTNIMNPGGSTLGTASEMSSDVINFAAFMRLLAPAKPTTASPSELFGQALFSMIGCNLCHSPSLNSGQSYYPGMSNVTYHPYSDFALHHMGSGLADGITQGNAGPDQFRTAPLWGVGQRLFFLHDGRTSDLLQAIQQHFSSGTACGPTIKSRNCASEANGVIMQFNRLNPSEKQAILNFLRSL